MKSDRAKILAALSACQEAGLDQPVHRVLDGQRPAAALPGFFMEVPRLIFVLEGCGNFVAVEREREVRLAVAPGQALFLAPFTWICPAPQVAYRSLGVILRPDSTRFTIHARSAPAPDGTIAGRYLAQWRTLSTLGAKGDHLLALLRLPPAARTGEREHVWWVKALAAELHALVERAEEHRRPSQDMLWQSVCDYLSEHWSDPGLSRKSLAQAFRRHPNHFSRFFHRHTQKNFREYLNDIRLQHSVRLLRDPRYNVTEVAHLCGFTDVQYFIRCFRRRAGVTPGEYRKRREG